MMHACKRRRIGAMASGPVVLALFAWFALTACEELTWLGGPPDPPTPGPDAVYDDIPVHEGADGGMTIASIHCDGNGKYLGGGNPVEEDRAKRALDEAVEKAKQEIKDIDNRLDRCKGTKKRTSKDYKAEYGCRDEWELGSILSKARAEKEELRVKLMVLQTERLAAADSLNRGEDVARARRKMAETDRTMPEAEAQLADAQRRLDDAYRLSKDMSAKCDQARNAEGADPCSQSILDGLNAHRSVLRDQAAMHAHRKDRFDKCVDDRKRRAQAPSVRPTVDPAVIQMLPGILNRPSTRPSRPAPSQPSHHKE